MSTRRRAICAAVTVASATVACRHGSVEAPAVWVAASERSPGRAAPAATAAKTSTASITTFDLDALFARIGDCTSLARVTSTRKSPMTQPHARLSHFSRTLRTYSSSTNINLPDAQGLQASPPLGPHTYCSHKITSSTWRRRSPPCRAAGSRGHQSSRAAPGCTGRSVGATSGACQSM